MSPYQTEMLLERTKEWQSEVVREARLNQQLKARRRGSFLRRLARRYSQLLSIFL